MFALLEKPGLKKQQKQLKNGCSQLFTLTKKKGEFSV